jgi:hypothetical protein
MQSIACRNARVRAMLKEQAKGIFKAGKGLWKRKALLSYN